MLITKKIVGLLIISIAFLSGCTSNEQHTPPKKEDKIVPTQLSDPIMVISNLAEQQRIWKGTRYRLGGQSKTGIDCSGFVQLTFRELFNIQLPRTTSEQANEGVRVEKENIKTGDLVFFKTRRGPNGGHVGIYIENGKFLHASTKGGVIYSNMNSPYWKKTFWQARRL